MDSTFKSIAITTRPTQPGTGGLRTSHSTEGVSSSVTRCVQGSNLRGHCPMDNLTPFVGERSTVGAPFLTFIYLIRSRPLIDWLDPFLRGAWVRGAHACSGSGSG